MHPGETAIDRTHRILWILLALIVVAVAGTACGPRDTGSVTVEPTATRVPTPTALPPLPTVPPPGSTESPLVVVLVEPPSGNGLRNVDALAEDLADEAGLAVVIQVVDSYQDAYQALCLGHAAAAALNAFSYLAAREQGCAEGLLVAELDGETATQGQLVAAAAQVFSLGNFRGQVFCRPGGVTTNGWILPGLAMRQEQIDPFTQLAGIVEATDDADVLRRIGAAECLVGATAAGAEGTLPDPAVVDVIQVLPSVPNEAIAVSAGLNDAIRAVLSDALADRADDLAQSLRVDAFVSMDDAAYDDLAALIAGAGVDVTALGE